MFSGLRMGECWMCDLISSLSCVTLRSGPWNRIPAPLFRTPQVFSSTAIVLHYACLSLLLDTVCFAVMRLEQTARARVWKCEGGVSAYALAMHHCLCTVSNVSYKSLEFKLKLPGRAEPYRATAKQTIPGADTALGAMAIRVMKARAESAPSEVTLCPPLMLRTQQYAAKSNTRKHNLRPFRTRNVSDTDRRKALSFMHMMVSSSTYVQHTPFAVSGTGWQA
eukprot:3275057-Rhodomonas_salina.1